MTDRDNHKPGYDSRQRLELVDDDPPPPPTHTHTLPVTARWVPKFCWCKIEKELLSNNEEEMYVLGCVHAYFAKAESAFWNADSKRRSKTPLIQAIVRAQVNRKGVYMTSFKRGYNVILRSCFHQNQRFALTTIVNAHIWAAFMCEGVLKWFKTPRSKTPFTEVLFMLPSRRMTIRLEGMSRNSRNVYSGYCWAQVNRKGVYMTSFKRSYNVILRIMHSTRISVLL